MSKLTEREKEVLKMLCLPNQEIAKRLTIELSTVKAHVHNIFFKFPQAKTRASLMLEAIKCKLINLEEIVKE